MPVLVDIFRSAREGPCSAGNIPGSTRVCFRRKVVEPARVGRSVDDLIDESKLATQTVRSWVEQADFDSGRRADGLISADHKENARLRKRIRQLGTPSVTPGNFVLVQA